MIQDFLQPLVSCILANLVGDVNHCSVVWWSVTIEGKCFFFLFIIMSGLLSFCLNKISLQRRKRKGSSPVVHCGKKGAWGVSAHQPLVAPGSSQGLPDEPTADQSPSEKFKAPRRYKMSLMQWRFPQENQNFKLSTKLQERTGLWSSFLTSGQTPFTHYD